MAFADKFQKFVAQLHQTGVAKTSHYDVLIEPPPAVYGKGVSTRSQTWNEQVVNSYASTSGIAGQGAGSDVRLYFRVDSCDIPGRTIATSESAYYGSPYKMGRRAAYADVTMAVILSEDMKEKLIFDSWMDLVVGHSRTSPIGSAHAWDVGYPINYVAKEFVINQYAADTTTLVHSVRLINAFPVSILPLQSSWHTDDVHKLTVQVAYQYFQNIPVSAPR